MSWRGVLTGPARPCQHTSPSNEAIAMRLLLQSAMIFFGTLMAAGLLALGEPQPAGARHGGQLAGDAHAVLVAHARAAHGTAARTAR
jgi:hypothetical protein